MKLIDVAESIDKSKNNQEYVDISKVCEELSIDFFGWIEQDRLTAFWIGKWMCTDSYVGYRMYFLDDEPVAVSTQTGRKSDEQFEWFGEEAAQRVQEYLLSIIPTRDLRIVTEDLNTDIGETYKIHYNSNVLDWTKARYNGEPIEFIERIRDNPDYGIDTKSKVRLSSGEEKIVDIEDLDFVFFLKENSIEKGLDEKLKIATGKVSSTPKGISNRHVDVQIHK